MKTCFYVAIFNVDEKEEEILNYRLFQLKILGTESKSFDNGIVEVRAYFSRFLPSKYIERKTGFRPESITSFSFKIPEKTPLKPFLLEDVIVGEKLEDFPLSKRIHRIKIIATTAFGTGKHTSTSLTLKALRWLGEMNFLRSPALDIGTGTGILSIYLFKKKIHKITAIDNDFLACLTAQRNFKANRLSKKALLICATPFALKKEFPLIVANLTEKTHLDLIKQYSRLAQAYIVLSGIYEDKSLLEKSLRKYNFRIIKRFCEDKWWCLVAKKSTGSMPHPSIHHSSE